MRIYYPVLLRASRDAVWQKALIDTGSEVSIIPSCTAITIGALLNNDHRTLTGVHGDSQTLPIVVADVWLANLNIGGRFPVVMSDHTSEVVIGMDILKPLRISIDTVTHQLSVKNDLWEAVKTISGFAALFIGSIKVLESIGEQR